MRSKENFGILDVRPEFKPRVKHQEENMKKYFFGDFLSADF